jgi:hypothetical protein
MAVLAALLAVTACAPGRPATPSIGPRAHVEQVFYILPHTTFPALGGARFGGVSGLTLDPDRGELIGVSDDREDTRVFRLRVTERPFRVQPVGVIRLAPAGGPPGDIDAEGIARLPDGHLLISTEGIGTREPRDPSAILEYTADGRFVRQLPVPAAFASTPTGPLVHGTRSNEGFEGLTVTSDGDRLFTGAESPLAQDGPSPTFGAGGRTRILEYARKGDAFVPGRQFAYDLDALPDVSFPPALMINGLVELIAIDPTHLLALERAFVGDRSGTSNGLNRARLYRVDLTSATDVSGFESLKGRTDVVAAAKTLLLDLDPSADQRALAWMDNFEGMAFWKNALLIVSDDNFNDTQRTWFLEIQRQPDASR